MKEVRAKVTERELRQRMGLRYAAPEWNLYHEVTIGSRRADAIAINLWPSRGMSILGFEIKVTRSDWVKELRDPGKMERTFRECHSVYLVVNDPSIVRDDLPHGWGLIVPHGPHLKAIVKPAVKDPENSRTFWARILQHDQSTFQKRVNDLANERVKAISSDSTEIGRLEKNLESWTELNQKLADKNMELLAQHDKEKKAIEWLSSLAHFERQQVIDGVLSLSKAGFLYGGDYGNRMNGISLRARRLHEEIGRVAEGLEAIQAIENAMNGTCEKNEKKDP